MLKQSLPRTVLLVFALSLSYMEVSSQVREGSVLDQQYVYRNWNNQNGLPQNTVNDLAYDSDGYLWIATEEGLLRFDGSNFTSYNENNTTGLYSNVFYDISATSKGIWASSRNSVLWFSKTGVKSYDFRKHLNGAWIKAIEADSDNRLWVGSSYGDLFYIESDSIKHFTNWTKPARHSIVVLQNCNGAMYIGSSHGLWQMTNPLLSARAITLFNGVAITSIVSGNSDELWVGTAEDGLFLLGKDTLNFKEEDGLKEPFVNSLARGKKGELWIGTRSSGFQIYEDGKFRDAEQKEYSNDGVKSLLIGDDDMIWIGTNSSGLIQVKPSQIQMLRIDPKLAETIILPVYQHSNGDIWVGTAGKGVNRIRNNQVMTLTKENGLTNNLVLSVCGNDRHVYIGTANGLDRYDMATSKIDRHYTKKDGLTTNSTHGIFQDSRSRIWILTRNGGIHLMDSKEKIEKFNLPAGLEQASFLTVYEDRKGNLWFGSRGAGMIRYGSDGSLTHFNQQRNFHADVVYSFLETADGLLLIGTDKGLVTFSNDRFRIFGKESGLRFNELYQVLQDSRGRLWMSGNYGLQTLQLDDLRAALANPQKASLSVRLYNTTDGMANAETNGGFFPSGWKMQNGEIWFPTVQGIAMVDPLRVNQESSELNIHLQSMKQANNDLMLTGTDIRIPPNSPGIEITYASVDFHKASDISYYFRLLGSSEEWIAAGNRNTAYFSALAPGNYQFEVKAERYGTWSNVASLQFRVMPPFYQTWWFKILAAVLATGSSAGLFILQKKKGQRKLLEQKRISRAQLAGQEKERQVIGAELHDNINQQLATAKLYLDFAKSNENMRLPMIDKSETVVLNVINELRSLCKTLIPPTLKDIGLKDALNELLQAYTAVGKFKVHFECDAPLEDLDEDLRFSLFRITQEQMNNIAKHAEASNVWVSFLRTGKNVHLIIRDDGKGQVVTKNSSGRGLTNIRNRVALYNGKMEIKTEPGNGFELNVVVPSVKTTRGLRFLQQSV